MNRPDGEIASYLIELGKSLSNKTDHKETEKKTRKKSKIKRICRTLNLTKGQLKASKHPTDITKTSRSIAKEMYPDFSARAKMSISLMTKEKLRAIHGKSIMN